jgi:hypothetical protein
MSKFIVTADAPITDLIPPALAQATRSAHEYTTARDFGHRRNSSTSVDFMSGYLQAMRDVASGDKFARFKEADVTDFQTALTFIKSRMYRGFIEVERLAALPTVGDDFEADPLPVRGRPMGSKNKPKD